MTQNDERYWAECKVLDKKFPGEFAFIWDASPRLEVTLPIKLNNRLCLFPKAIIWGLNQFPETEPIVTADRMLKDSNGNKLNQASGSNHVLEPYHGKTRLCIYRWWNPHCSLYKTAQKAAFWFCSYFLHLITGRTIDCYLPHY